MGVYNMHCRSFTIVLVTAFFFVACTPVSVEQDMPTETAIPPATETLAPATQPPTATAIIQPTQSVDWLSQLEVIRSGNWSRLQLLKTFPAEMPLDHSAVAISPDGKTMAVGSSANAQIFFFDLPGGNLSRTVQANTSFNKPFDMIVHLADGTLLASSPKGYESYHIDANGDVLATWGYPFALSADGKTIAFGGNEGAILVDIAGNEIVESLEANVALSFSFSPDNSRLAVATAGVDYVTCYVWDIANRTLLGTLTEAGNILFSPNGKFLVVTSYEEDTNPLKIFSPDGITQLAVLSADSPNGLNGKAALISLDGSVIAAQIANGSPIAWDTTNWQSLDSPALQGELYSFSPDGRILVTRASDGSILLWGVLP
jgi:WD40 repeat protein